MVEKVIATALCGIGFHVIAGPGTRDGGKDVIASCLISGKIHKYYLEIKHWRSGKRVGLQPIDHFIEVNLHDGTQGGLFLSSGGFTSRVFSQLAQIAQRQVRLGQDTKMVSLCQRFVQRLGRAVWEPQDVLPQILWEKTLSEVA
jgi:hypothetical protein